MNIRAIRSLLALSQSELASLLGVHAITVSKWERDKLTPTAYQAALLDAFGTAARRHPAAGQLAVFASSTRGIAAGLAVLMAIAYPEANPACKSP